MSEYERLYEEGLDDIDVDQVVRDLDEGIHSWEDYYWGSKCLFDCETECDPDDIIKYINNAFRYGLSYRSKPELYSEGLKMLSVLYGQLSQYELMVNPLLSFIMMNPEAPGWVFHDLVSAQLHTNEIDRMIEHPDHFIDYINKDDQTNADAATKKKNIFLSLIEASSKRLTIRPDLVPDYAVFKDTARLFGVTGTPEWAEFSLLVTGNNDDVTVDTDKTDDVSRPVFTLFPNENAAQDIIKESNARIAEVLEQLNAAQKESEQLSEDNSALQDRIKELEQEKQNSEALLRDKQEELDSIKEKAIEQSSNTQRLVDEISKVNNERDTIQKQYEEKEHDLNLALNELANSTRDKEALETQIQELEEEKDQLEKQKEEQSQIISMTKQKLEELLNQGADDELTLKSASNTVNGILNFELKDSLEQWLLAKLPLLGINWFETYAKTSLTTAQATECNNRGWRNLSDFDLAALIQVADKMFVSIKRKEGIHYNREECNSIKDLKGLRNKYAHFHFEEVTKDTLLWDLDTIVKALHVISASRDTIDRIQKYRNTVNVASLADS